MYTGYELLLADLSIDFFEIASTTNETKGGWCSIFNIRSLMVDQVQFKKMRISG